MREIAFSRKPCGFTASLFAFAVNTVALLMGLAFCLSAQLFPFLIHSLLTLEGIQP